MKYSNGTITQCYICISLSDLVSCAFSTIPICPFFNSKNFSFTCTKYHGNPYIQGTTVPCDPLVMCYYIIQNIIETTSSRVPRLHIQRFERWSLGTNLTLALPRRRTECRLDFHHVTVSRGQNMAPALACARMRASLSRCVIARALRSPEKGDRSGSLRGPRRLRPATSRYRTRSLPVALSYVDLQSHARESEIA